MDDAQSPNLPDSSDSPGAATPGRIWRWPWQSRAARHARLSPGTTDAWLQIVCGNDAAIIARGALELAARFLAAGERVLIVEGGPRLRLHRVFGRETRPGLVEGLTGEAPILGLVQDAGRLGLYLLAYGTPARRVHWPQLGRLLDEIRPDFGRTVLAIEPDAPDAAHGVLAGWVAHWWTGEGDTDRHRAILVERLGIELSDLDLHASSEATLEGLERRIWALVASRGEEPPSLQVSPAEEFVALPSESREPVVVDCDLRVRERLRFMLWMKRIQTEGRAGKADMNVRQGSPS